MPNGLYLFSTNGLTEVIVNLPIRLFENILTLIVGGRSNVEGLGEQCLSILTIETDGEIRDSDVLSVAFEHAARFGTGAYLGRDCLIELIDSEIFREQEALYLPSSSSTECQDVLLACLYVVADCCPTGSAAERSFDNPSIYCGNLKFLFAHVRAKLLGLLSPDTTNQRSNLMSNIVSTTWIGYRTT